MNHYVTSEYLHFNENDIFFLKYSVSYRIDDNDLHSNKCMNGIQKLTKNYFISYHAIPLTTFYS